MSSKTALKEVPDFISNPDVKDKYGKPKTYQKVSKYHDVDVNGKRLVNGFLQSPILQLSKE